MLLPIRFIRTVAATAVAAIIIFLINIYKWYRVLKVTGVIIRYKVVIWNNAKVTVNVRRVYQFS